MENKQSLYMLQGFRTQRNPDGFTGKSRILEIQEAESARRAALLRQAETLCSEERARHDAVRKRLGLPVQIAPTPSLRPPALARDSTKFSHQGRRIGFLLDVPRLNVDINKNQRSPENVDEEEDDSFWDKVRRGGQMAADACKAGDGIPTAVDSLSPADRHTPSELRAIGLIEDNFRPTLPPRAAPRSKRRASRLPVFSAKLRGEDETVGTIVETLQNLKLKLIPLHRPPAAPNRTPTAAPERTPVVVPKSTPGVAPLAPAPTKKRGTRRFLRPPNAVNGAGKRAASDRRLQTADDKRDKLQPLTNPVQSLSFCFKLLSSDDWMKKTESLKIMQALAQHHSETLQTKLHEVCVVLTEEVNNLRSAVACEAMNTLAKLYVDLQKAMDPEVEGTGQALLLNLAQTTNVFIHQQANLALDAMVENCSYGQVVSVLLKAGLSHGCVAVRRSAAQHLHQVADSLGASRILTAGRRFTKRVLIAVAKMCVDAAPTVRHHGWIILQELSLEKDFMDLWTKIVPEKERRLLHKILL